VTEPDDTACAGGLDPAVLGSDLPGVLRSFGVDEDDIAQAAELGTLELLALERILEGSGPRYDIDQVAELSGIDRDRVLALWRALGFPEPRPGEQVFSDLDLEMLADTIPFIEEGGLDLDLALQMTRVIGSSVARIATAQVESITAELDNRRREQDELQAAREARRAEQDAAGEAAGTDVAGTDEGGPDDAAVDGTGAGDVVGDAGDGGRDEAAEGLVDFEFPDVLTQAVDGDVAQRAAQLLPMMPKVMEFVWRRHTANAARRKAVRTAEGGASTCVGFADLVGFTAQTQQLGQRDLAEVVGRFEAIAHDLVTRRGGRVIKMIGDEVMFSADHIATAVDIALAMADTYRREEGLSDVRVGLACGEVLERDGDLFGPVVNMASRIVKVAFPGAVVVSPEIAAAAVEDGTLVVRSIRSHYLKDIGKVRLCVIRRASDDTPDRYEKAQAQRLARREFVSPRLRDRRRGAVERSGALPGPLPFDLSDGAFLDDPTEEIEAVTDAVLEAEIDEELQVDLLADIEAARRLDALEREALAKAAQADDEAERKITEAEQEARRRVEEIEKEARRRIEEALEEAEAKAAKANEEASRKVEAVARDTEKRAGQAERDARRKAERRASRHRRSSRGRSWSRSREELADTPPAVVLEDLGEELRDAMEEVAEAARQAAERARAALGAGRPVEDGEPDLDDGGDGDDGDDGERDAGPDR
jgi:class 3 adenylate cyclase